MKYKPFKILICPACGKSTTPKEPACHWCGFLFVNHCMNESCDHMLDGNARFCVECGDISIYYKEGLLADWEDELDETEDRKLGCYIFRDEDLEAFEED